MVKIKTHTVLIREHKGMWWLGRHTHKKITKMSEVGEWIQKAQDRVQQQAFRKKWTLGFNGGRDVLHHFFHRNHASHFLSIQDVSQLHFKFATSFWLKKMSSATWGPILNGHRTVGSGHFVVSQDFRQPGLWKGQLSVHGLASEIRPNLSHLNFKVWGYNSGSVCKCNVVACQNLICCLAGAHTPVSILVTLLSCETGKVYTLNTCYSRSLPLYSPGYIKSLKTKECHFLNPKNNLVYLNHL